MFRTAALIVASAMMSNLIIATSWAEGKVAILVGNSNYEFSPLENPANDTIQLATSFQELGFETQIFHDLGKDQLPGFLETVEKSFEDVDIGVLYFAGHGVQHNNENLLVSVDADLSSIQGLTQASLTLSDLLDTATSNDSGVKIVILDACRNALVENDELGLTPGFRFEEAPRGEVLIAFSTSSGELAFDSTGGPNSPYTTALVNALHQTDRDIYDTFRSVRGSVRSATGGLQIPWITGSIESDFVFRPAQKLVTITNHDGATPIDEVLWEFLQYSVDPQDTERFLTTFPNSRFASDALAIRKAQLAQNSKNSVSRNSDLASPQAIQTQIAKDQSVPQEGGGRNKPILDQSGAYVLRDSFRIWPLELPQTKSGLNSVATSCDEEAADPDDPGKLTPGVSLGVMDIRRALRSCAFDLAADPENPRLQFQFARALDRARRYEWANDYYELAIEGGYSAAMVNRGFNARMGRGGERDPELSTSLYRRAALLGNPRARTNLGGAFLAGRGVEKNLEEGILWLRLAASSGWPHATNALGDAYWAGRGVEKDRVEAVDLYRSSAQQGQTTGMANLGRAYLLGEGVARDTSRGLELLEQAIASGNGFAALHAGRFYLNGNQEVAANPTLAKQMFEAATRRGARSGYLELARGYEKGAFPEGVDLEQALRNVLFARASRHRNAEKVYESITAKMEAADVERVSADVQRFIKQNGL